MYYDSAKTGLHYVRDSERDGRDPKAAGGVAGVVRRVAQDHPRERHAHGERLADDHAVHVAAHEVRRP